MNAEQLKNSIQLAIDNYRLTDIQESLSECPERIGIIVESNFAFSYWKHSIVVQAIDYPYVQRSLFTMIAASYRQVTCDLLTVFLLAGYSEGISCILSSPFGSTYLSNMRVDNEKRTFIYIFLEEIMELDIGLQYQSYFKPKIESINNTFALVRNYHLQPNEQERADISMLLQRLSGYIYYDQACEEIKFGIRTLMSDLIKYVPNYSSYSEDIKFIRSQSLMRHILNECKPNWDEKCALYMSYNEENFIYNNTLALGNRRLLVKQLVQRSLQVYCIGAVGGILVSAMQDNRLPKDTFALVTVAMDMTLRDLLLLGTVCKLAHQVGTEIREEFFQNNVNDKEIYERYCKFANSFVARIQGKTLFQSVLDWLFS